MFTYARNPNAEWCQKLQKIIFTTFHGNSSTKYGNQFEIMALKLFQKHHGRNKGEIIKCGLIVNIKAPWLGFSPDGFYKEAEKELVLLEVKCPVQGKQKTIDELLHGLKYLEKSGNSGWKLKKKHAYYSQIQCGLLLSNLKLAKLLILSKKEKKVTVINVQYDEEFCSNLIFTLRNIYFTHFINFLYDNNVQ